MSSQESLSSQESIPKNIISFDFGTTDVSENVLLSTHVDTIQAMLLVFSQHQQKGLHIKGRCVEQPGQIMTIMQDEMVHTFMKIRATDRASIFDIASAHSGKQVSCVSMTVEDGLIQNFPSIYYSTDNLLYDWSEGKVSSIQLLPILGGATTHSIGSDTSSVKELNQISAEIIREVRKRQLAGSVILGEV